MAVEPLNVENPKPGTHGLWALVLGTAPTITVFGLFILNYGGDPRWLGYLTVGTGIFLVCLAVAAILKKQVQLEKRLDELERLKN